MGEPYEQGRRLFEAVRKDVAPSRAADMAGNGQKARWLRRAQQREVWAAAAENRADEIERSLPDHARDPAFMTQPGAKVQRLRDKMTAREQLAWSLRQKAAAHREAAANLRGMAGRNKGDAESARQSSRERITKAVRVGDFVDCVYGIRRVLKVNEKTLRLEGALEPIVIDKALCAVVPVCCGACASWRKPTHPETEGECWSDDRLDNKGSGPAGYTLPTSGCEAWWPRGLQPRPDGVDGERP